MKPSVVETGGEDIYPGSFSSGIVDFCFQDEERKAEEGEGKKVA
jgi:hypothetical protein